MLNRIAILFCSGGENSNDLDDGGDGSHQIMMCTDEGMDRNSIIITSHLLL